ncbi:RNA polymerase sigma factor [bacterium]|nr:RNA polymerase sigma factor [bacterium]
MNQLPPFELLFEQHKEKIFRLVYRMTGDDEESRDLTQEVFLSAYKSCKKFRQEANFYSYLYRIAVNTTLNHLKRKKKTFSLDERANKVDWELEAVKPIGIENIETDPSGRLNYIYTYSVGNPKVGKHIKERWEIWPGGEHEYAGCEPPKRLWFHSPTVAYNAYGEVYAGVEIDGNSETDRKTFIGYEQFIIDDLGHIQSRSRGSSPDVSLTNEFPSDGTNDSPLNRELIITATEFNGRTIDLVKPMRVMAIQLEPVKEAADIEAVNIRN